MNVADVMTEVFARLDTIPGLNCFPYPPDAIQPPAAFPSLTEPIDFDLAFQRGMDRINMPVVVAVSRTPHREAWEALAPFMAGSGASSVKTVLESGTYTAFDEVRVTRAEFKYVGIAGTEYLAALLTLAILGEG